MFVAVSYLDECSGDLDQIYGPFPTREIAQTWRERYKLILWAQVELLTDPQLPAPAPTRG